MKKLFLILALLVLQAVPTLAEDSKIPASENFVRLSLITVDPARLEEYKAYLKEGVTASMSALEERVTKSSSICRILSRL